ncbi:MAG TPA: hypothetical protein VMU13_01635 [Candidatus Paceibacterota bacterium]|nr:hypothetical protein [Candidatus Paceibacterota bacterium]
MSEFAKMDAFFFITTLVVVVVGALLAFILFRIWRILGHVEEISKDVSEESELLRNDLAHMRSSMQTGFSVVALGTFLNKAFKRFSGRSGKRGTSRERDL